MDPKEALDELSLATLEAFDYGYQGRIARGYRILTVGLFEARKATSEGADQVVELWEQVMARFRQRFPNDGYLD